MKSNQLGRVGSEGILVILKLGPEGRWLLLLQARRNGGGPARQSAGDLVDGGEEMVIDGGDAGKIELGWRDGARQHLHPDGEEAADGGGVICGGGGGGGGWRGRSFRGEEDEAGGEKGNVGRILAAHCDLNGIDVDRRIDYQAATRRLGAALL